LDVLAPRVAAHRRLVDGHDLAPGVDQSHELVPHDRHERLGHGEAVRVVAARLDPARERVRTRNRRLESRPRRCELPQAPELLDDTEAAGCAQLAGDAVTAALVVRRRAEAPARLALRLEPGEERVEGEVEVEAGLLPVGDDVEPRTHLIADRRGDGIADRLLAVVRAEVNDVLAGELEPAGKGVAAGHGRPKRVVRHRRSLLRRRLDSYTVAAVAGAFDLSGRRVVVTGASSGIGK